MPCITDILKYGIQNMPCALGGKFSLEGSNGSSGDLKTRTI